MTTAQRWFLRETGAGQARANILAAFYRLLAAGDPTGGEDGQRRAERQQAPQRQQRAPRGQAQRRSNTDDQNGASTKDATTDRQQQAPLPSLSVAVQVYIDKDMTPDQVDHVFASMARHLYGKQ
jgi:hypothetical protein